MGFTLPWRVIHIKRCPALLQRCGYLSLSWHYMYTHTCPPSDFLVKPLRDPLIWTLDKTWSTLTSIIDSSEWHNIYLYEDTQSSSSFTTQIPKMAGNRKIFVSGNKIHLLSACVYMICVSFGVFFIVQYYALWNCVGICTESMTVQCKR